MIEYDCRGAALLRLLLAVLGEMADNKINQCKYIYAQKFISLPVLKFNKVDLSLCKFIKRDIE